MTPPRDRPPIIPVHDAEGLIEEITKAVKRGQAQGASDRNATTETGRNRPPGATPTDAFSRRPAAYLEVNDGYGNRALLAVFNSGRVAVVASDPEFGQRYTQFFDPSSALHHMEGIELPENLAWIRESMKSDPGSVLRVAITPQTAKTAPLLDAVMRLLGPLDIRLQDGMRALLSSATFQQLFGGEKLGQGATQMFPNFQLLSILLPQNLLAQNVEAAKALLIAQGLPATLIQHIPDQALAGALNSLFVASQQAGKNPLLFLQSVASIFTLAGVPVQQVQNLLLGMLHQSQQVGLPLTRGVATPEGLERWAARLMAANNPQLLGLNALVQENFGAGVTKILNAFIRVFFGGALMQGQMPWPQAVPNERMLAELSGLFAKQNEKPDGSKEKRKSSRKRRAKGSDAVEAIEHARVERKTDIADDPPLPPEMTSVFVDVDGEEV